MPLSPKGTHNNWNAISFTVYMIMCDPFGVGVWGMSPTAGQDLRLGTCDPFGVFFPSVFVSTELLLPLFLFISIPES